MVCATSKEAFELGEFLCKEYEKVRQKEQEMNKRHEESRQAKPKRTRMLTAQAGQSPILIMRSTSRQ